jgi:hypothetical protein
MGTLADESLTAGDMDGGGGLGSGTSTQGGGDPMIHSGDNGPTGDKASKNESSHPKPGTLEHR